MRAPLAVGDLQRDGRSFKPVWPPRALALSLAHQIVRLFEFSFALARLLNDPKSARRRASSGSLS